MIWKKIWWSVKESRKSGISTIKVHLFKWSLITWLVFSKKPEKLHLWLLNYSWESIIPLSFVGILMSLFTKQWGLKYYSNSVSGTWFAKAILPLQLFQLSKLDIHSEQQTTSPLRSFHLKVLSVQLVLRMVAADSKRAMQGTASTSVNYLMKADKVLQPDPPCKEGKLLRSSGTSSEHSVCTVMSSPLKPPRNSFILV